MLSIPYKRLLTVVPALFIVEWAICGEHENQIGRTTEKEVNVVLSSALGTVIISKGEPGKILIADPSPGEERPPIRLSYVVRNRIGYLEITLGEESEEETDHSHGWALHGGEWHLKFCDEIPLSFDIELGLGKGEFDLTGLHIKDFTLTAGASDVSMNFDAENRSSMEHMSIESGVSKFNARNLGNANFKYFRFEGGVGTYYLDFGGSLSREVDVDVNVGLGVLTLVVPREIGARLSYEKSWMSSLDCDRGFDLVEDGEYLTDNYHKSVGRMNIRVESGLGSVKIRRQ